ncbi:PREDICTED: zinc finger BED domain-containing protein 6-like [Diuraphis noxia]|uniref:zinc finger BED domain-containing protein 6-like n=1 Tax=Diuraphis noxia TaxID=143948 RepID=UPI0007637B2B|nr:PREDICTED: zinc finger BED domain-containing protein 6-like [Diuraphis noxia]
MGITAHFINEDAMLQSVCLGCEMFDDKHTTNNLSTYLKNTVEEWNIQYKITAVVSDNAPNIVGAIKKCNFRHVPCFAHCINLVVQSGLKEMSEVQKKVKSFVEYFKRSSHALSKLQSTQKQMGLTPLKLKQDCHTVEQYTRYVSAYYPNKICCYFNNGSTPV